MFSKESGLVVIVTGTLIMTLGVLLLFDKALVMAGHILMITGFAILFKSHAFSLFSSDKLQGTSILLLGVVLLFCKYQVFGFILELAGLFLIFKATLPSLKSLFFKLLFRSK